jgi:hypothetical protein
LVAIETNNILLYSFLVFSSVQNKKARPQIPRRAKFITTLLLTFGNPAILMGPVALRHRLASVLLLSELPLIVSNKQAKLNFFLFFNALQRKCLKLLVFLFRYFTGLRRALSDKTGRD